MNAIIEFATAFASRFVWSIPKFTALVDFCGRDGRVGRASLYLVFFNGSTPAIVVGSSLSVSFRQRKWFAETVSFRPSGSTLPVVGDTAVNLDDQHFRQNPTFWVISLDLDNRLRYPPASLGIDMCRFRGWKPRSGKICCVTIFVG